MGLFGWYPTQTQKELNDEILKANALKRSLEQSESEVGKLRADVADKAQNLAVRVLLCVVVASTDDQG